MQFLQVSVMTLMWSLSLLCLRLRTTSMILWIPSPLQARIRPLCCQSAPPPLPAPPLQARASTTLECQSALPPSLPAATPTLQPAHLSPRLCCCPHPWPHPSPSLLHLRPPPCRTRIPSRLLAGGENSSLSKKRRDPASPHHQGTSDLHLKSSWTSFSRGAAAVQANVTCSSTGSTIVASRMRPTH